MSPFTLQTATAYNLLPAWVTDIKQPLPKHITNRSSKSFKRDRSATQQIRTTTPKMPLYGPFKVKSHRCKPTVGFCETCGHYHGKEHRGKASRFHQRDYAKNREMSEKLDETTQSLVQGDAFAVMQHPGSKVLPFHGNNVQRRLEREMSMMGGGLVGEGLPIAEDTDQGIALFSSSDEQLTFPNGMLQDSSHLSTQEIQNFDTDMADLPAFPSCYDMDASTSNLDFEQSGQGSQTFLPQTSATSSSEHPGMASIEQFNSSYRAAGHSPTPTWIQAQDLSSAGFEQEESFDSGSENTAGELMDAMQY